MKLLRVLAVSAAMLAGVVSAFANGDPVMRFSSITSSGNPVPRNIMEVEVVSEKLVITPGIPYSTVTVDYTLQNNSSKDFKKIDYGFPIDYYGSKDKKGFDGYEYSESSFEIGWWDQNLKDVGFFLDGQELKWHNANEVVTPEHKEPAWPESGDDEDLITVPQVSRLWTYTEFSIPAHGTVNLKVTYSFYCEQEADLFSVKSSPYTRYIPYRGCITYDLSPASHWGSGKTASLEITVDTSRLPDYMVWRTERRYGGVTDVTCSPEINWEGFVRDGENWVYKSENFAFKDSEPLTLDFSDVLDDNWALEGWRSFDEFEIPSVLYSITEGRNEVTINFKMPQAVTDFSFLDFEKGRDRKSTYLSDRPFEYDVEVEVTRADGYVEEVNYSQYQLFRGYREDRYERAYYNVTDYPTVINGRWVEYEEDSYVRDPSKDDRVKRIKIKLVPREGKPDVHFIKDIKVYNVL